MQLLSLLPLLALIPTLWAMDDNAHRQRRIYQVVTDRFALTNGGSVTCNTAAANYCGGTYKGMIAKLDYIQGMGFDTVWISPIVQNIGGTTPQGQAYHGYWTLDPDNLRIMKERPLTLQNSNFGSADDLKALSAALHARGMYLMVDVVVNHVAATSSGDFKPSSAYGPFNATSSFHPFCWITDYTNQTQVEQCWLGNSQVALPDLNTESSYIVNYWQRWIKNIVSTYSVDLLRFDTVKHIRKDFWPDFVAASGVSNVGEILDGDAAYVGAYQKDASVNPFNYPVYYPLTSAFNGTSGNMTALINMVGSVKENFQDPTLLGQFLNNHDNPRIEGFVSDQALIKNAHAYSFIGDGVPHLYYGSEAGFTGGNDPLNREALWTSNYNTSSDMYQFFTKLNAARSAAGNATNNFYTSQMSVTSLDDASILISKPPLISILTNRGSSGASSTFNIPQNVSGWANNMAVMDAVSCTEYKTASNGALSVPINGGLPVVLIESTRKGNLCAAATQGNKGAAGKRASVASVLMAGVVGVVGAGIAMML